MSLSRNVLEDLCESVKAKPSAVLGHKFFDCRLSLCVDVAQKAEKFETKIFAISKFRIFVVHGKTPSSLKVEKSFHLLNIKSIHCGNDELGIIFEEGSSKRRISLKSSLTTHQLAIHILSAIKHYFPDICPLLTTLIEVEPASLYDDVASLQNDVMARPCHSFRRTYAAMCDFYDQPYREEVSWDVEKIYTVNKLKALRIEDFSHLPPKDLLPIVGVLQYSAYFTGITADGVRLPPDVVDVILSVVRKSPYLAELQLKNCVLGREFILAFASSIMYTSNSALETLDFSRNPLDDKKGFAQLCLALPRLTSLRILRLADCGLSEKSVHSLCSGLYNSITSSKGASSIHGLKQLCLSSSSIKEDSSSLVNLISLSSTLRVLDLSDTGLLLDKLWPCLKYGGLQLEELILSGCHVGKKNIDVTHTVKEFFSQAVGLSLANFSSTVLNAELLKAILLGLSTNQQLKPYELVLDGSCDKGCGVVLESCLPNLRCKAISLRDNALEADMQGVLAALSSISTLRKVDLGGNNFTGLRRSSKSTHSSALNRILLDIVKLYSDDSQLEELIISKAQLGSHLSVLLNTLGATTSLRVLDISNNEMSNFGARILSKALQLNVSLQSISIDNNKIGPEGYADIASAMNVNYTLTSLPYPLNDILECKNRNEHTRCMPYLAQIEMALERNKSLQIIEKANAKKALSSGLQNLLDTCPSSAAAVDDAISSASLTGIPQRLDEMVDNFVDQLRVEARVCVHETIAQLGSIPPEYVSEIARAEKSAVDRLKELWVRDLHVVLSDWRWRELCERSEQLLRSSTSGTVSAGSGISNSSAPTTPRSVDAVFRPRSIVADADDFDSAIRLDTPPKPSGLVHLQKSRPRRRMGADQRTSSTGDGDSSMNQSIDTVPEEDRQSIQSEDSARSEPRKPIQDRPGARVAMLPEALTHAPLRPASDRMASPRDREPPSPVLPNLPSAPPESPPPPLPQRNRVTTSTSSGAPLSPPQLPPKPEPRTRTVLSSSVTSSSLSPDPDDENANSRRSVADMTRIFGR